MKKSVRAFLAAALCGLAAAVAIAAPAGAAELLAVVRPDCATCTDWERDVGAVYAETDVGKIAPLRRVGIDGLAGTPYVLKQPVTDTPTFILMDGTLEIGRITGYSDRAEFWGSLGALLNHVDPEASPAMRKAGAADGRAGG